MPGIGKSAVARELARRLAEQYPDGQLTANLGNAGVRQSTSELLRGFLIEMGWRDPIPAETEERAELFRALTADRRVLFLLDAARDPDQVKILLPGGAGCAVIVTSRRDLGPALGVPSKLLELPSADQALDILHAVAGRDDLDPECAAELIDLCGRLPVAIKAMAERIPREASDLCDLRSMLRASETRLESLTSGGRSFLEGVAAEYRQLSEKEQRAFCLLALVESPTFVSWVLSPLLQVRPAEAESLMTRLNGSQLVELVRRDDATELVRYRMHPLVRLYAERQLASTVPMDARDAAQNELEAAYETVVVRILRVLEPTFELKLLPSSRGWLSQDSTFPQQIAFHAEPWIRAEFLNLRRCAARAYDKEEWGLCWRVASWLGGCIPEDVDADGLINLFTEATDAADRDGDSQGRVDVLIAHGWFLTALERYPDAHALLEQALRASVANGGSQDNQGEQARRRQARAHLVLGEGYLQMRACNNARTELAAARSLFEHIEATSELALLDVFIALNGTVNLEAEPRPAPEVQGKDDGHFRFWALIQQSEQLRRGKLWRESIACLRSADIECAGDVRRIANVAFRSTRVHLEHLQELGDAPERHDVAVLAIRRSAEAVHRFRRMGNPIGETRARCLLLRALVAAGRSRDAEFQWREIDSLIGKLEPPLAGAYDPIAARAHLAHGVLLRSRDDLPGARDAFIDASLLLKELGDGRSEAIVRPMIDEVLRRIAELEKTVPPQRSGAGDHAADEHHQ
jgi:hypothetical protein